MRMHMHVYIKLKAIFKCITVLTEAYLKLSNTLQHINKYCHSNKLYDNLFKIINNFKNSLYVYTSIL